MVKTRKKMMETSLFPSHHINHNQLICPRFVDEKQTCCSFEGSNYSNVNVKENTQFLSMIKSICFEELRKREREKKKKNLEMKITSTELVILY